jgi:hypothetical protein
VLNKQGLRAKSLLRPDDAYETLTSTCMQTASEPQSRRFSTKRVPASVLGTSTTPEQQVHSVK